MPDKTPNAHASQFGPAERRLAWLCLGLAFPAYALGRCLLTAIGLVNNLAFHGRFSLEELGAPLDVALWACLVPAFGGLLVGLIARFGSPAVRGHGIPEVIETVHAQDSRVPWRVALLKPLCAAISIGTGGPFGAEGPVIGLGGSLGSLLGQWLPTSPWERKVLLSAGAAAGITAVFGCPVAAMLLAVEILLFEFRPASMMAVGLACGVSATLRMAFHGTAPVFVMPLLQISSPWAWAFYVALGLPLGLAAAGIVVAVHGFERLYTRLPVHWMWWPALGGLAVGVMGLLEPRIFGPGYATIADMLNGRLIGGALALFVGIKLLAWLLALGSGTAGGTLAPLFGIGGGLGALLTWGASLIWPDLGLDPRMGAVLGMAAVFAGASHAVLASILLALETTHQAAGALPLLTCCMLATLVCQTLLPYSLMTEGPARRGVAIPNWGRR